MTTTFDTSAAALVLRLLAKFGVTASMDTVVPGVYDAAGGVQAPATTTTTTLTASPPLSMVSARAQASDGGRVIGLTASDVLPTDLYVLIGVTDTAGAAVPAPTAKRDRFTIAGVKYAIHEVGTIYSGDLVAAYELHLRKS